MMVWSYSNAWWFITEYESMMLMIWTICFSFWLLIFWLISFFTFLLSFLFFWNLNQYLALILFGFQIWKKNFKENSRRTESRTLGWKFFFRNICVSSNVRKFSTRTMQGFSESTYWLKHHHLPNIVHWMWHFDIESSKIFDFLKSR